MKKMNFKQDNTQVKQIMGMNLKKKTYRHFLEEEERNSTRRLNI